MVTKRLLSVRTITNIIVFSRNGLPVCVGVCARVCLRVCVRACMRACVRVCACVRHSLRLHVPDVPPFQTGSGAPVGTWPMDQVFNVTASQGGLLAVLQ